MSSELTLWDSPNGIQIKHSLDVNNLVQYNQNLSDRQISKITNAFNNELFDMSAEYAWLRTINVLKGRVLKLGEEFVMEMLGKDDSDANDITEIDVINLAADLGFINKKAKMDFMHNNELINYYSSREGKEDEMNGYEAGNLLTSCFRYVLGIENNDFEFSFNDFREKLKHESITDNELLYQTLKDSPYFYKRTTVNTLLSLSRKTEGGELDRVLANMVEIIPGIWNSLLSDDRWPIGIAYAEEVNQGNKKHVGALKSVLLKVNGFDYVPESLRSNTFTEHARKLIEVHNGFDNFYNEPGAAKSLSSLGTIPTPALGICITASLSCKMGNHFGNAYEAETYVDKILKELTLERWDYYFNKIFIGDELVLTKLISGGKPLVRWNNIIQEFVPIEKLSLTNSIVKRLLTASNEEKNDKTKSAARQIYEKIR